MHFSEKPLELGRRAGTTWNKIIWTSTYHWTSAFSEISGNESPGIKLFEPQILKKKCVQFKTYHWTSAFSEISGNEPPGIKLFEPQILKKKCVHLLCRKSGCFYEYCKALAIIIKKCLQHTLLDVTLFLWIL